MAITVAAVGLAACGPGLPKPVSALVTAARSAMLAKGSVHIDIEGYKDGKRAPVDSVVGDIGLASTAERIVEQNATVTIRVTPAAAFFTGNKKGLTNIAGLTLAQANRAGTDWVELKKGTSQYKSFSSGATLSGLVSSLLPTGASAVKLKSAVFKGSKVKELTWKATVSGSSQQFTQELFLSATDGPLAVDEISIGQGESQTGTFADWGEHVSVPVPAAGTTIGFSAVTKG